MKAPIEWLKEYVTIRLSPTRLAQRLTMAGLEVVGIDESGGPPVLDLEITPNRADCLSIIGIAREISAVTGQRLRPPPVHGSRFTVHGRSPRTTSHEPQARPAAHPGPPVTSAEARSTPRPAGHERRGGQHTEKLSIRIEDRKGCSRYIGRLITGVRVAPSPAWMQRRLLACGVRPIYNVVDVTNYVLLEYGQPLHAFDFARLAQGTLLVRRARPGESLVTLDGVRRPLDQGTLVIADAQRPVAVAGVMGGTETAVTEATTSVLLESARFDPVTVRRAARRLGLATESSYRFERGVDPVGVETASVRAAALLGQLAGGIEGAVLDAGAKPSGRTVIALEPSRVSRWLGVPISPSAIRTSLARLSCHVASDGRGEALRVGVPPFRQDLRQEVDLYEELARLSGYDRLPSRVPNAPLASPAEAPSSYRRLLSLRRACAGLGLAEVITWSLVSEAELLRCGLLPSAAARLSNPLSQDQAYLRPSLLMGLMQVLRRNLAQGAPGVRVFEIGSVVREGQEEPCLGIALAGLWLRDWRAKEVCELFYVKGILQTLGERCWGHSLRVEPSPLPWAEPGQSGAIHVEGRALGAIGEVSRAIRQALDLDTRVWFAELSLTHALEAAGPGSRTALSPSSFPPVKRDLSIVLRRDIPFAEVTRVIGEIAGSLAGRVELIDRYTGPQVPPECASLTFSIEYRHASRTLTAEEADALHQRIRETIASRFDARLR